jgi:hypothetical protein
VGLGERFAGMGDIDTIFKHTEINSVKALQKRLNLPMHVRVGGGKSIAGISHPRQVIRAGMQGMRLVNTASHVAHPYRKSFWGAFMHMFKDEMASLITKRFRSDEGFAVNTMYHHYMRAIGMAEFYVAPDHVSLDRRLSASERVNLRNALLTNFDVSRFCLNDGESAANDGWLEYIENLMTELGYSHRTLDTVVREYA